MSETIQGLVPLSAYQPTRSHLFPSLESARWFVRKHQRDLIDAGALLVVAGRHVFVPEKFDQVVLDIGKRLATQRAAA